MKRLLAGAGVAFLGLALSLGFAPKVLGHTSTSQRPSDRATVAAARAAFTKSLSAHAPIIRAGAVTPGDGTLSSLPSINWSGYADTETTSTRTFSHVSASWTIPAVTCPPAPYQNQDAFIANWVGLDGVTDQTVEQLGTGAECFEGVTYYYVWYELYPSAIVEEGTTACINDNVDCPRPGDQITASVSVRPGVRGNKDYQLALTDDTTPGNNFSVSQECAADTCLDTSAEWIVERPATVPAPPATTQILPLVDFASTGFTQASETSAGITSTIEGFRGTVYDVLMTDDTGSYYLDCVGQRAPGGTLLSTTNPRACPAVDPADGNSFNVTWDASF